MRIEDNVNDNRMFTVKEVATLWGVSQSTVRRIVYSGELLAIRIGRCVRIPAEALKSFMDCHRYADLKRRSRQSQQRKLLQRMLGRS